MAILLEGDLGSGKTCFVQGVARGLEVPPEVPVSSPTYTLMNQYTGRVAINHFDLYRLGSANELVDLDFDDYLLGSGVTIVEWAGMVDRAKVNGLSIKLDYGKQEDERNLRFAALGGDGEEVLEAVKNEWKEV
jgi:tRNA threonylcarbamoyladenosine biosynthesis protein TsaE